jgi:hypothetical protein
VITKLILHFPKQDTPRIHIWLCENVPLSLRALPPVQKSKNSDPLHHTRSRVAEELTARFQASVDADIVLWRHVEIAGFRRVVGRLLGDVVAFRMVGEFPIAGERLAEDWVEWFLHSSAHMSDLSYSPKKKALSRFLTEV